MLMAGPGDAACVDPHTTPSRAAWSIRMILAACCMLPATASAEFWIYTAAEGDNLWDISEKYLDRVSRFEQLQKINGIEHPTRMRPGTRLRVPMEWIASNPEPAEIVDVHGTVELEHANGEVIIAVAPGARILLGDEVTTGPDSSVAIRFADNSVLSLYADSSIRFDYLGAYGQTGMVDSRLRLLKGRADSRVKPAVGPGSRFEIGTPSAVSAVRGTNYRVAIKDDGQTSNIEVLEGGVAVSGADKETLVGTGYGTRVTAGKPPISPRKLLEPPTLDELPGPIQQINWPVTWQPLPGALRYRTELAAAADFNTLRWQQLGPRTRAALPDLPDGSYFLRVRGVDELGLEGKSATREILLDAHPQPPVPLKPVDGQVLRGKTPELQWTDSADAARYHLEIALDERFGQVLVDRDNIKGTRFASSELSKPAKYYWRLASIAADGERGPTGVTRSWEIKAVPDSVDAEVDSMQEGKIVASWRAGAAGQSYQVQLAFDPKFREMQMDVTTTEPEIEFDLIKSRARYLRVRAIEPDGYKGPWGTTQRVDPAPSKAWIIPLSLSILVILLL
jgi:hypothetical protein